MIVIVFLEIDLHPVDLAAELVAAGAVVRRNRRSGFLPDVAGLVAREDHRRGHLDTPFSVLLAVNVERDRAALGQAAAVVLELHAELMLAGREGLAALGEEAPDAE